MLRTASVKKAILAILCFCVFLPASACSRSVPADGVSAAEARVRTFLQSFGWEVSSEPSGMVEVSVPKELNAVWSDYNRLQIAQGFDLAPYCGRSLLKYVFSVLNYPGIGPDGTVKANVFTVDGVIVGGDICRVTPDGFLHGFRRDFYDAQT